MAIISGVTNDPDPTKYKAPTIKPVDSQVDSETETVEKRLNNLTSGGSAYVNLHESETARQSNSRGLINSTIAKGAGREAAIKSALPIAQQDASTYTDTRFKNQEATNRFKENQQNANLNKESASHQSSLVRGEMNLGSDLTKGEMTLGSALTKDELIQQSALTNQENTLLNDLTMKRDQGLSTLTQVEQAQLNELEMKRDSALHVFDLNRDTHSSQLNEDLAVLESSLRENEMTLDSNLKTQFETHMNDERFSDEAKIQIVNTMSNIVRDTQQQIADIGMSDRSAAQQASAIALLEQNRDALLEAYQDVLGSFNDWNWGADFTADETRNIVTTEGGSVTLPSEVPQPPATEFSSSTSSPTTSSTTRDDIYGGGR